MEPEKPSEAKPAREGINRRQLFAGVGGAALGFAAGWYLHHIPGGMDGVEPMPGNAHEALDRLKEGNERFSAGRVVRHHQSRAWRHRLTGEQRPYATVLGCSDSRVPVELVFDQGFGDLFVVRVAGNVATDPEIASIEYAADHLHTPLVVVMGHQSCGAVGAAIAGGTPEGHLPTLVNVIQPAVDEARKEKGDLSANAVRINVERTVQQLRESKPVIAELVAEHKVRVVGAVYSLDTGRVQWLPETSATAEQK